MSKAVTHTPRIVTTTKPAEAVVMDAASIAALIAKYRPIAAAKAQADRTKASRKR